MKYSLIGLLVTASLFAVQPSADEQAGCKLLIAFASYAGGDRGELARTRIHFYEHDGVSHGTIVGSIEPPSQQQNQGNSQSQPSLSHDGRFCACACVPVPAARPEARILFWDRKEKKAVVLNQGLNVRVRPSLSGDGKLLAFCATRETTGAGGWDIYLCDVAKRQLLDPLAVNTDRFDERMPALSGDGHLLAYTSNAQHKDRLTDIYLLDRREQKIDTLPALNSPHMDIEPSLSGDGRLIAFVSDRPGGMGGRDIYLFDRAENKLVPLPGLNSAAHEQSPSLSPNGRFIVFVSERVDGQGGRDIYLYDRQTQKLLPTPGLNSKWDDFDPCVIVLQAKDR